MYRSIDTALWTDPKVKTLPPEGKLLFLYLITNNHAHVSGIYTIPSVLMAHETGLDDTLVDTLFHTLSQKKLALRDQNFDVIWVVNMLRYQGNGPKIKSAVEKHLPSLHGCPLIPLFVKYYKDLRIRYMPLAHMLSDTLLDTLSDTLSDRSSSQEQEQEQIQEQEQEKEKLEQKLERENARTPEYEHAIVASPPNGRSPGTHAPAEFAPTPAVFELAQKHAPSVDLETHTHLFKTLHFQRAVLDWDERWYQYILEQETKATAPGRARAPTAATGADTTAEWVKQKTAEEAEHAAK